MTTATAAPPLGFVVADLRIGAAGGRRIPVTAELTAADGLVIAPRIRTTPVLSDRDGPVEFLGTFGLVHVASGARIPTDHYSVPSLRVIAARVAHLDWTAPDHGQYGTANSPWWIAVQDADAEATR